MSGKALRDRLARNPWLWLGPVLLPLALFFLIPVIEVARLSFHRADGFDEIFVGLGQFRRLFRDPAFGRALAHTALFTLGVVPTWIGLTLLIAIAIVPMRPWPRRAWSSLFFLTYLVSPVVLAMVWTWMLSPEPEGMLNRLYPGLVNAALSAWGSPHRIEPLPWLASPRMALAGVIISTALTIPGSGVLLYGAALSALPSEIYEAARLEGAGRWAQWRWITLPLLRPTTLYLTVIYTIASFQVFERVYIMTGGGPAGATTVLVERLYATAFLEFDFGNASAQAVVLAMIIAVVAAAQFRLLRGVEQY